MLLLLLWLLSLVLGGCPFGNGGPIREEGRSWGVQLAVDVKPGAEASSAEVEVTVTRPSYQDRSTYYEVYSSSPPPETSRVLGDREVKKGEHPYDNKITIELHWSCPKLRKSGKVDVKIAKKSAKGTVKIAGMPPQPHLAIYPWEFKRGLECIIMTADEKLAQEEAKDPNEDIDYDEEIADSYRGERAFFIKKHPPQVQVSNIKVQAGSPDSYADIKVELLRNKAAVMVGDRSFDMEVEVKLPWICEGQNLAEAFKSGNTHIVIPTGASSGEARLILPAKQEVIKLTCALSASAYIDSYLIGNSSEALEVKIPPASE